MIYNFDRKMVRVTPRFGEPYDTYLLSVLVEKIGVVAVVEVFNVSGFEVLIPSQVTITEPNGSTLDLTEGVSLMGDKLGEVQRILGHTNTRSL